MNIEAFEKRAQILKLRSKIMMAEAARLSNEPTVSLDEARKRMREKLTAKPTAKLTAKLTGKLIDSRQLS